MPARIDDTFIPVWLAVVGGVPSTILAIATLVKTVKTAQAERVRKHRARRAICRNTKTSAAIKQAGVKVPHYEAQTASVPVELAEANRGPSA